MKKLYNQVEICDNDKLICKTFSKILNDFEDRCVGAIYNTEGCSYSMYHRQGYLCTTEIIEDKYLDAMYDALTQMYLDYNNLTKINIELYMSCNNVCDAYEIDIVNQRI